jgi:hypothetical protein
MKVLESTFMLNLNKIATDVVLPRLNRYIYSSFFANQPEAKEI